MSRLGAAVVAQFRRPSGLWGRLVGLILRLRASNVARNQQTVALLGLEPHHRVLEIGFGPGLSIAHAASLVTAGQVVGVDHSPLMVAMAARHNAQAIAAGRVVLREGTADGPSLPPGPFDRVMAVNVAQFWADPVQTLRAVRARMVPGGRIALTWQPRKAGAADQDSTLAGERLSAWLAAAGFVSIRVERLPVRPVAAACALAACP